MLQCQDFDGSSAWSECSADQVGPRSHRFNGAINERQLNAHEQFVDRDIRRCW